MDSRHGRFVSLGLVLAVLSGCDREAPEPQVATPTPEVRQDISGVEPEHSQQTQPAMDIRAAEAHLVPTEGNEASGNVRFQEVDNGVEVTVHITGLTPGSMHGFHIHEVGDCSAPDASTAGEHYDPHGHPHALPPEERRHAGDMGNLVADDTGAVAITHTYSTFSLNEEAPVVGRAVILHSEPDEGTQPSGDSGARIACGVILPAR